MNLFDLKNRTAIITGGAQGFGLDIAKRFLKSGSNVILWDNDENELKKASETIQSDNLSYNLIDVSDYEKIQLILNEITKKNKIDILINNAGITGPTAELWDYEIKDWHKIIDINLHGTFYCCKYLVPHLSLIHI